MKTGILWDLDGTLLDTLEDLMDGVNYALHQFGLPPRTYEEIRQFVGNGAANLISRAVEGRADGQAVLDTFKTYYNAHCQVKTKAYDGVLEALAQLGEKYPMAIVSNKPDSAVKPLCEQYFPGIYSLGERAGCPRKPAADMVFAAMKDIGVETCVYVGDSEVDVATAKNAGVTCLSVLWGFRDREALKKAGAEYFCEDTKDLAQILRTLAKQG